MKSILSLASLTVLLSTTIGFATPAIQDEGTLNITVMDEQGNVVKDAPVYIYGEHRTRFVGGSDVAGSTTFSMKEGSYRISSAMVKKDGDYFDHYTSNEAHVAVVAGDHASLVLTLSKIQNEEDQGVSYATLHIAAVPGNLFNNN